MANATTATAIIHRRVVIRGGRMAEVSVRRMIEAARPDVEATRRTRGRVAGGRALTSRGGTRGGPHRPRSILEYEAPSRDVANKHPGSLPGFASRTTRPRRIHAIIENATLLLPGTEKPSPAPMASAALGKGTLQAWPPRARRRGGPGALAAAVHGGVRSIRRWSDPPVLRRERAAPR